MSNKSGRITSIRLGQRKKTSKNFFKRDSFKRKENRKRKTGEEVGKEPIQERKVNTGFNF